MRFLGITETCDLGSLYLRLQEQGHEVRVLIDEPLAKGTLAGMVAHCEGDLKTELDWIREAGAEGFVLFEAVSEGLGALQDALRRDGLQVIGGSAFGDRLENDRAFAFDLLAAAGMRTAPVHEFDDGARADAFLAANPGRYVLKFSGADHAAIGNYVGQLADGRDVRAVLKAKLAGLEGPVRFILMDFLEGVEMGVGAYFDGERFLMPACLDWEHKRFFAGDMGELTGEMGTVATFERSTRFFEATLARLAPQLEAAGHVGYVNLNTIVNESGIWPLELTCRFGYPGFAILEPLQDIGWAELFRHMARRDAASFPVRPGYSVGIVLSTPPFPYSRKEVDEAVGLPVVFRAQWKLGDLAHLHYGEVGIAAGQLVTSGLYGWTMVVTGTGPDIQSARAAAYARCRNIAIPDMRYRLDIGDKLIAGELDRLETLGLLG